MLLGLKQVKQERKKQAKKNNPIFVFKFRQQDSKPFNSRPVVDKSNEETASRLLEFAQNAKLLTSTPGNISFRGNEKSVNFLVTPRKVNKSQVRTDQLVYVSSDLNTYK